MNSLLVGSSTKEGPNEAGIRSIWCCPPRGFTRFDCPGGRGGRCEEGRGGGGMGGGGRGDLDDAVDDDILDADDDEDESMSCCETGRLS